MESEKENERMRIDVWNSLKPQLQAEVKRTKLTASEIVNMIIAKHFGLFPESK